MRTHGLVLTLLVCCISCISDSEQGILNVNRQDIEENAVERQAQLVDVQTAQEYKSGHITNVINFNVTELEKFKGQLNALDKEASVYLYCKSGVRSKKAAQILKREGFHKIFDYSGGYDDWEKSRN